MPQNRRRFIAIGSRINSKLMVNLPLPTILPNAYPTVFDAISDLEQYWPVSKVEDDIGIKMTTKYHKDNYGNLDNLKDSQVISNHIIPKTREHALKRFEVLKEGENFHDLENNLKENTYTDSQKTQNTIYSRLTYNTQSGTVVNVRKSMWIHPKLNRAISVREAARLQTFPDSFTFYGKKDSQYQQVGNAVPPLLSKAIANKVAELIDSQKLVR